MGLLPRRNVRNNIFPFQLSFPEPHRVRQEEWSKEKLVFQAGKAARLSDLETQRIVVSISVRTGTVSAPYEGIKAREHWGAGWAPSFHLRWWKTANS